MRPPKKFNFLSRQDLHFDGQKLNFLVSTPFILDYGFIFDYLCGVGGCA